MSLSHFARRHWVLLTVLGVHGVAFALLDTVITPHPDYIDHWMQSRVMEWGYYEHPPMIAWLLRALTSIVGDSEPALEGIAIFLNLGILAGMYALGVGIVGVRPAAFGLLAAETTPFFIGGTPLVHIDQPLLLFWLAALWALVRYQRSGRPGWLLAMGVLAGLGALSKYTMVLFYLSALAYLLLVKERRRELLNPYVYAAGLLSLAVFSPVLIWNAQHGWVSILFQLSKGGHSDALPGKHLAEFTLGYLFLFSPVLVLGGAVWFWRRWRREGLPDTPETLLLCMWIVPVAFFSAAMIPGSFPDPQYVNEGFLSFYPLLGRELVLRWDAGWRRGVLRLYGASAAVCAVLLGLFAWHAYRPFLPMSPGSDPTRQIVGWHETGAQVTALLHEHGIPDPDYVISFYYPLASQFSLHLPSRPRTYSLQRELRNAWTNKADLAPGNTVIVCERDECGWLEDLVPRKIGYNIKRVGEVDTVVAGTLRRTIGVYRMLPGRVTVPPP